MNYRESLQKVSEYVTSLYADRQHVSLTYHNYMHIVEILDAVKKMAEWYKLNEQDYFIVCCAAWFHDTGYLFGIIEDHESKSAELAADFLKTMPFEDDIISEIKNCIYATKMPQNPLNLQEQIICDADLFNLGLPEFAEHNNRLKKEIENISGTQIKGSEWRKKSIALLESHKYYTEYCRLFLEPIKALNLETLKRKQEEKKQSSEAISQDFKEGDLHETENVAFPKSNKRSKRAYRGIETMFRVTFSSHQKLSTLADNKAHIMISVNSIVISITIGLVLHSFSADSYLIIPTIILLLVNVATIIFSVLATRPKIHNGTFTEKQLDEKTVNLLFYGSFYKMNYKEYEKAMISMINDNDFLYGTMIKDIYWQGRVMGRKFRLLRISYNIFMYGIAVAVIAYAIATILNSY